MINRQQFEYIPLLLINLLVIIVIAAILRLTAISLGLDSFTASIAFVCVIIIGLIIYSTINIIVLNIVTELQKRFSKAATVEKRCHEKINDSEDSAIINEDIKTDTKENSYSTELNSKSLPSNGTESQDITIKFEETAKLREQNRTKIEGESQAKIERAINYTQHTLAPHLSDRELSYLSDYIQLYANGASFSDSEITSKIKSITPKGTTTIDLYHWGWNIWHSLNTLNTIKERKRIGIALFLKVVFAESLSNIDSITTIEKSLRKTDGKYNIKLDCNI